MTRLLFAATLFALGVAPLSAADDDHHAKAKAVVEKAITAAGWDKDTPTAVRTWKDKGKFSGGGMSAEYTGDWAFARPDKYRFTVSMTAGDQKFELTVIANGDRVWEAAFGMTRFDSEKELTEEGLTTETQRHREEKQERKIEIEFNSPLSSFFSVPLCLCG